MSTTTDPLKSELTTLTADQRAKLAHFLIQTLDVEPDGDVNSAWQSDVTRRIDEIKAGTEQGTPADEVIGRLKTMGS